MSRISADKLEVCSVKFNLEESLKPFLFAGISSSIAAFFTFPIETVKVRLQQQSEILGFLYRKKVKIGVFTKENEALQIFSKKYRKIQPKDNFLSLARNMMIKEGYQSFFKGIQVSILRQLTYSTVRLGLYKSIYTWRENTSKNISFLEKIACGVVAGFFAPFVSNPFDVCMIRMQIDSQLPEIEQKRYKGILNAFSRIYKEEGFMKFYSGLRANMIRVTVLTSTQMIVMEEAKIFVNKIRSVETTDNATRILAAFCSGFCTVVIGLPFDNIKMKLQKMNKEKDGLFPYRGFGDCLSKTVRREGVKGLWTGFGASYASSTPYYIICLGLLDLLHYNYSNSAIKK